MAKKKGHRNLILLVCGVCKRHNYVSEKNKITTPDKLDIKKYCKWCKKHTTHKERTKLK